MKDNWFNSSIKNRPRGKQNSLVIKDNIIFKIPEAKEEEEESNSVKSESQYHYKGNGPK
jgi:hypothetical protein